MASQPMGKQSSSSLLPKIKALALADVKGELDADPITEEALADIIKQMEDNVINVTLVNHGEDQRELNRVHQAMVDCTETMQDSFSKANIGINVLKAKMEADDTAHTNCRKTQVSKNETDASKCTDFKTFAQGLDATKPDCACAFPAGPSTEMLDCLVELHTWGQQKSDTYVQRRDACNVATKDLDNQKLTCDNNQATFESAFCSYGLMLTETCSTYASCREMTEKKFTETQADVEASEKARKTEYTAAKSVICYVGVLQAIAADKNSTMAAWQNATYDTTILNIQYLDIPAAADCDTTPVKDHPCTDDFLATHYESKSWSIKAPAVACSPCAWKYSETPSKQERPTPEPAMQQIGDGVNRIPTQLPGVQTLCSAGQDVTLTGGLIKQPHTPKDAKTVW